MRKKEHYVNINPSSSTDKASKPEDQELVQDTRSVSHLTPQREKSLHIEKGKPFSLSQFTEKKRLNEDYPFNDLEFQEYFTLYDIEQQKRLSEKES
jgi:hypothetical protein